MHVSNELGGGNVRAAVFSVKVIVSYSLLIGVLFWVLLLAFGHEIAHLVSSNEEVVEAMSGLTILLAFSFLLNGVQPVLIGKYRHLLLVLFQSQFQPTSFRFQVSPSVPVYNMRLLS